MKKYFQIFKNSWSESFIYRLNFIMWRLRMVINILIVYFLWSSVTSSNQTIFGYSQSTILTYILGVSLLRALVLSSRTIDIANEINEGNLAYYLLKPINYYLSWFTRDLADKLLNIIFSVFEITLIILLLKPNFFLQTNPSYLLLFLFSCILAAVLYFFINMIFGFLAFWTPDTWPPRFIFFIFLEFFAGSFFPIDILPRPLYLIVQSLPFPYMLYFPLKIYLGQLPFLEITKGFLISALWVYLTYLLSKKMFNRGLSFFSAEGR